MPRHLEPVPSDDAGEPFGEFDITGSTDGDDDLEPLARPSWWRWVAIAVIVALVLAGPLAVVLYRLLT